MNIFVVRAKCIISEESPDTSTRVCRNLKYACIRIWMDMFMEGFRKSHLAHSLKLLVYIEMKAIKWNIMTTGSLRCIYKKAS